jgi:hypothetical protein
VSVESFIFTHFYMINMSLFSCVFVHRLAGWISGERFGLGPEDEGAVYRHGHCSLLILKRRIIFFFAVKKYG